MVKSIVRVAELVRSGKVSPVELTQECLDRVAERNQELNAFITVTADSALDQAQAAKVEIQHGKWRGPLHGIPVALKDLIDVAGVPTTAASAVFRGRIAASDATVARRLKAAGAVLLGKLNMHEFAYGGSSVVSAYGPVCNARNREYIAGGSSGGSATAVAAGLCYAALGTDTAGSVREPAALCGVVGLKPKFGLISVDGVFPLAPSFDHVGPITRTVSDAAIVLSAIAGNKQNFLDEMSGDTRSLRIGVPRNYFLDDLDNEVAAAFEDSLRIIGKLVASIRDIHLDVNPDRTLQAAESFAVHADFVAHTPELYQPETLRRIRTGENFTAGQVRQAGEELKKMRQEVGGVFQEIDLIVTPTTPIPAPKLAALLENPDQLRTREILLLRNTRPFNVWGLPAISIPCGFTKSGLPIGLQIAGAQGAERLVLRLARAFEPEVDCTGNPPGS